MYIEGWRIIFKFSIFFIAISLIGYPFIALTAGIAEFLKNFADTSMYQNIIQIGTFILSFIILAPPICSLLSRSTGTFKNNQNKA